MCISTSICFTCLPFQVLLALLALLLFCLLLLLTSPRVLAPNEAVNLQATLLADVLLYAMSISRQLVAEVAVYRILLLVATCLASPGDPLLVWHLGTVVYERAGAG